MKGFSYFVLMLIGVSLWWRGQLPGWIAALASVPFAFPFAILAGLAALVLVILAAAAIITGLVALAEAVQGSKKG